MLDTFVRNVVFQNFFLLKLLFVELFLRLFFKVPKNGNAFFTVTLHVMIKLEFSIVSLRLYALMPWEDVACYSSAHDASHTGCFLAVSQFSFVSLGLKRFRFSFFF